MGHGPPMFFITLSCAEYYWPDIIRLIKERTDIAGEDSSNCYVGSPTLSKILNEYSLVVQEYFQARVETWLKTVGKEIFGIEHYWVRFEFAPGRGQIHAHLLAISRDNDIYKLCHNDMKYNNGEERRARRLAEWAENKFGLTASVSPNFDSVKCEVHPSSIPYSQSDPSSDADALLKSCQEHHCSGYCMRKSTNENEYRRECRSGAGFEKTRGECDTPGFKECDSPYIAIERKSKKLRMQRNHTRINQSSVDMLRSWRGNCDIQILIYDSSPENNNIKEISQVTDYVVGYTCKGGTTLKEERETNKHMAMQMEEITGDSTDLTRFAKQVMNKASSRRLITKQECCVLLSDLRLTLCSEQVSTVSLSCAKRIHQGDKGEQDESFLRKYMRRHSKYENKSLYEYFHIDREIRKQPYGIPHSIADRRPSPQLRRSESSDGDVHSWHRQMPSRALASLI